MSSRSGIVLSGCVVSFVAALIIIIAFSTPCWLESDPRVYTNPFYRLGLWEVCFRNLYDYSRQYDQHFVGCRWIFDEDFWIIRDFLQPPFFMAVQAFFTMGLFVTCVSCLVILMLLLNCCSDREGLIIFALAILKFVAGICTSIGIITFAARGDGRDWIPWYENNYLSWSFGIAVIGSLLEYVAGILFLVKYFKLRWEMPSQPTHVFSVKQPHSMRA